MMNQSLDLKQNVQNQETASVILSETPQGLKSDKVNHIPKTNHIPNPDQRNHIPNTAHFRHEPRALKLHRKLATQVQTERKVTYDVLLTIQEFDITKSYLELGYSSLYDYLTKGHGYSEGSANRRISSARLLKQNPEISSQIQEGKLNLTQLALAQSAMRQEEKAIRERSLRNQDLLPPDQKIESLLLYWVNQMNKKKQMSQKDQDKIKQENRPTSSQATATQNSPPLTPSQPPQWRRISWKSISLKEKDLSQQSKSHMLGKLADQKISSPKDSLKPAKSIKNKRNYIPVRIKKMIFEKAQHRCEYHSPLTNKRCQSHAYLDTEHATPIALGGTDDPANLRVICRAHNQLLARQLYLSVQQ